VVPVVVAVLLVVVVAPAPIAALSVDDFCSPPQAPRTAALARRVIP
jgi:hypothetical protein